MRIAWLSNAPWARTGYGTQCNLFAPRMKALGHEVAVICFYGLEGGTLMWNGMGSPRRLKCPLKPIGLTSGLMKL